MNIFNLTGYHLKFIPGETKEKGFVTLRDFETELPAFMAYHEIE